MSNQFFLFDGAVRQLPSTVSNFVFDDFNLVQIEKVVDPTGAGDSFAGGFMGHISSIQNYSFDDLE